MPERIGDGRRALIRSSRLRPTDQQATAGRCGKVRCSDPRFGLWEYRYAVAEFVDNFLQADATSIVFDLMPAEDCRYPLDLLVIDDGSRADTFGHA
jgi:hypothetical protein